jgi:predicted AlkP superfamily phosphohydrolase/phosphomutase
MWRLGFNYKTAVKIAFKTGFIARWVINKGEGEQESLQRKVFLSLDDVDWPNTQAYSAGNYGQMYLNVKGRDAQGCINPADYDRALDRLEQELRTMRDPETGEPVIDQVWRKKDLFQGKYADQAPDLVFFTKGMLYKAMGLTDFATNAVFEELYGTEAHHHMNGVLMFSGPGIKAGTRVEGARLIDMAPTIFHLMNVPIPTDLDGRVLTEAFTPGKLEQAPQYESTSGDSGYQRQSVYSEQEEAELTEMLRNLGYVG